MKAGKVLTEPPVAAVAVMLLAAIVLGGGGTANPATEILLQLAFAVTACALAFVTQRTATNWRNPPPRAIAFAAVVLAVPLLHLLPLPASLWTALPARQPMMAGLTLAAAADTWRPLSLVPSRTLASFLAMVPPTCLLLVTAGLRPQQQRALLLVVGGGTLASVLVGGLQLASGNGGGWSLYAQHHIGNLVGFQANRNAQADVLQIGLLAVVAYAAGSVHARDRGLASPALVAVICGLLSFAVVMTGSRAGISILPVTLGIALFIAWPRVRGMIRRPALYLGAALAPFVVIGAMVAAKGSGVLSRIAARFSFTGDAREDLWVDAVYALGQVWPAGGGMGSFQPLLMAAERLEVVDPSVPMRAHNDWLEFLVEAGLPGIAALTAALVLLALGARDTVRAYRTSPAAADQRALAWFGFGVLAIIGLHSIVDYPLRSMSLASLAACAAGVLLSARPAPQRDTSGQGSAALQQNGALPA